MKYARILAYVMNRPWAMHPGKMQALAEALRIKAEGGDLDFDLDPDNGGVPYEATDLAADRLAALTEDDSGREARIAPARAAKIARATGRVAVLPVRGVLSHRMDSLKESSGNTTYERLGESMHRLMGDDNVKAIVLDVNSPGGVTDGLPELAAEMRAMRGGDKPIVACVNTMAASGAYWLAAQADELVVTPSGEVGSIGVYTMHEDISALLDMEGVKETLIFAGEYKVEGNPFEPLSDEAREAIQADVDAFHEMFLADVAAGRGVTTAVVAEQFGKGRTVLARDAAGRGMADRVATLEETLNRFGATLRGQSPQRMANNARRAHRPTLQMEAGRA